jgi:SAM-dependent methyltransferase
VATSFDYARQAATYDTTRAASPSVLDPLRDALGVPSGALVDVGGGTGNYAAALAAHGWDALVVDHSPAMLAVAAGKGVRVCRGDAAALPLARRSAGGVMLVSMLHHVPDWAAALAEARRVAAPGAVVALVTFAREHLLEVHGVRRWFPETSDHFAAGHQTLAELVAALPGATVAPLQYTDVVDGAMAAMLRVPHLLLDAERRRQTSFFEWAEHHRPDELRRGLELLAADLEGGWRPDPVDPRRRELGDASLVTWRAE